MAMEGGWIFLPRTLLCHLHQWSDWCSWSQCHLEAEARFSATGLQATSQAIFFYYFLFSFFFFKAAPTAHGSSWTKVESKLQLLTYSIATAMPYPSFICDLCCSLQQCQIINPPREARAQTHIVRDTSWVLNSPPWNSSSAISNMSQGHIWGPDCQDNSISFLGVGGVI